MYKKTAPFPRACYVVNAQREGANAVRQRHARKLRSLFFGLLLPVLLGLASGLACAAARLSFGGLEWCFTGHSGMLPDAAAALGPVRRACLPALGGLLAWAVLRIYKHVGPAEPFTDYGEAVREKHGVIPFGSTAWRTVASAFSIATGAAIGREGSMIQFATACASFLGLRCSRRWAPGPVPLRPPLADMVAWGAAAAVAAAYQAPVAGVFFASELVLARMRLRDLAPLGIASCTGWLASRPLLGPGFLFAAPAPLGTPSASWWWLLLMAPLFGMLGPAYQWLIRSLGAMRSLPLALVWSGVAVGLLSLKLPTVWGNGDAALLSLVHTAGPNAPAVIGTSTVLLFRLLATCLCVGAGVIGGVFTPTLFAGAALGALFASGIHSPVPLLFIVAGIGCLMAAVTHAPLMTTFMTVELTGKWALLPLLLLCNLAAWRIAARLSSQSLYGIATSRPGRAHASPPSP